MRSDIIVRGTHLPSASLEGGGPPDLFAEQHYLKKITPKIQVSGTFSMQLRFLTYLFRAFSIFSTSA